MFGCLGVVNVGNWEDDDGTDDGTDGRTEEEEEEKDDDDDDGTRRDTTETYQYIYIYWKYIFRTNIFPEPLRVVL